MYKITFIFSNDNPAFGYTDYLDGVEADYSSNTYTADTLNEVFRILKREQFSFEDEVEEAMGIIVTYGGEEIYRS